MENSRLLAVLAAVVLLAVLIGLGASLAGLAEPEMRTIVILGYSSCASAAVAIAVVFLAVRHAAQRTAYALAIVEKAADGIITVDENGLIEQVNSAAVNIFGYRTPELVGCNFSVLFTSAYSDEEQGTLWDFLRKNAITATGTAHEVRGLRRDGQKFYMDLSISDATINDRTVFVAIVRDVTERKLAQIALQNASDLLERRVEERTAELKEVNGRLLAEIEQREKTEAEREKLVEELQQAIAEIKTLSGFIPICASCKKVRDDGGYWNQIEVYLRERSDAEFSHGICPDCIKTLYPELSDREKYS